MGYIILIGLAILIIYGLVKLIIWLAPKIAIGLVIILAVGGVLGLLVGIFYGIKNYMQAIHEKIDNRMLKYTMMVITSLFVILVLMYMVAAVYFFTNYLN
jgi:hypothetical protein